MSHAGAVLITGTGGMIGSHLSPILSRRGEAVIGSYYRPTIALEEIAGDGELVELDVHYFEPVRRLIEDRRPGQRSQHGQPLRGYESGQGTRCKLRSRRRRGLNDLNASEY